METVRCHKNTVHRASWAAPRVLKIGRTKDRAHTVASDVLGRFLCPQKKKNRRVLSKKAEHRRGAAPHNRTILSATPRTPRTPLPEPSRRIVEAWRCIFRGEDPVAVWAAAGRRWCCR